MIRYRGIEPVDVAVVSGLLATAFGAILLFLSTQGSFPQYLERSDAAEC